MALVNCSVCEKKVSERAASCPHCGEPEFLSEKSCPDCNQVVTRGVSSCPECGNPEIWSNQKPIPSQAPISPAPIIHQHNYQRDEKSMVVGLLLTFFFGPLGLLYTNIKAGLILTVVVLVLFIPTLSISAWIGWLGSMIWAAIEIDTVNKGGKPLIKDFE